MILMVIAFLGCIRCLFDMQGINTAFIKTLWDNLGKSQAPTAHINEKDDPFLGRKAAGLGKKAILSEQNKIKKIKKVNHPTL